MTHSAATPRVFTAYPELNLVLDHLLRGVQAALADNFVGAYLQGSFAVGDYTPYSDCDFIVVTREDLTPAQLDALQILHKEVHRLPAPYWHNGLEGSYAPAAILRRWTTEPRDPPGEPRSDTWGDPGMSGSPPVAYPFWYLDHGSDTLVRSEHDNSQVVRWCLREKGVILNGPDPTTLIDPVSPAALKSEVRKTMDKCVTVGLEPMHLVAWQAYWVGLFCRILHTMETGTVTSKKAAMTWAETALDPRWSGLIARAKALRKGHKSAGAPSDPAEVEATRAFVAYAIAFADR